MTAFLSVREMTVAFGGTKAVQDVSFEVESGETFGIVGPNGAGKTSLLNGISRLVRLARGQVFMDGVALHTMRPHQLAPLGVARTFQAAEVFNDFRVMDYLMLGKFTTQRGSMLAASLHLPVIHRVEKRDRLTVLELLDRYTLAQSARIALKELPYGQRKLLDILRATLSEPKLLLLDEPTSGSAVEDRVMLREVLGDLRSRGITIVVIDHDVKFVSDVCDRLLVMSFGEKLGIGVPSDVINRPEVRAAYTGLETE
jgi:branched-chain amino acid transport system ATP-binding protein